MEPLSNLPTWSVSNGLISPRTPFEEMQIAENMLPLNFDSLGFSRSEWKFLVRIAGSTGAFEMNNFRSWRKGAPGAVDQAFLNNLKRHRFCTVQRGPGYLIIILTGKRLFRLIGMENSRLRKRKGPVSPKALLCSEYLSQCPHRVLITPREKVEVLTKQLLVAAEVIPRAVYRGQNGTSTIQYFPERFPMFVYRAGAGLGPEPVLGIVYADDPERSHFRFSSFLNRNREFLMSIRRLHFIYVSANFTRCEMARVRLEQFGKEHEEYMRTTEGRAQEAKTLVEGIERREEAQQRTKAWERFCGLHMRAMNDDFNWTNNEFTFYGNCLRTFGDDAGKQIEREIQEGRAPTPPPLQSASQQSPKSPQSQRMPRIREHFWECGICRTQTRLPGCMA
jgi:hypothetical protein